MNPRLAKSLEQPPTLASQEAPLLTQRRIAAACAFTTSLVGALALTACSEGKKGNIQGAYKAPPAEEEPLLEDEPALSLEEIISQCGLGDDLASDPDAVLMEKSMTSWPKVFVGTEAVPIVGNINFKVKITTKTHVKATMTEMRQVTDFDIEATPSQARGPAEEKAAPNRGSMKAKLLTSEERTTLMGEVDAWAGIICTLQPAKEVTSDKGGNRVVSRFHPPLPVNVSPKADPARYLAELEPDRIFDDIEAEIISSSHAKLRAGDKLKGTVKVTKVIPTLTLNISNEDKREIKADLAFKIDIDFGSVEQTAALGLLPSTTYYISHTKRDFVVIVSDTGFEEGGTVVMSDQW